MPRFACVLGAISVGMLVVAGVQSAWIPALPADYPVWARELYRFQWLGFLQLGVVGIALAALLLALHALKAKRALEGLRHLAPRVALFAVILFLVAEVGLRVIFWNGMSFGVHRGPIVRAFEQDFRFNRFRYGGGSRGPDLDPEAEKAQNVRVLVQGDSITWGQGVKDEEALYTSVLLRQLRERKAAVEMAVLARGGRNIDGHLDVLEHYRAEIEPDVVVYQFFINDMELKSGRPTTPRIWRELFFHRILSHVSYFWFFLDERLDQVLPANPYAYTQYINDVFGSDTPQWEKFEGFFGEWVAEAKKSTPRILVLLWPQPQYERKLDAVHERVQALCSELEVASLDLTDHLEPEHLEDPTTTFATRYDAHPNAEIHALMARVVRDELLKLWPDVLE